MRIKQLADAAGVPVDTIRHYERSALLAAPARRGNGYREYGTADVERLRFIRHCRDLDMSLPEVRALLQVVDQPGADCSAADRVVHEHLAHVRERLAALRRLERELLRLAKACGHPQPQERCGIVMALAGAAPRRTARSRVRVPARGVHS